MFSNLYHFVHYDYLLFNLINSLSVLQHLDVRYDMYLCQTHHLPPLFLLLQDESLSVRTASLQLLGRLAEYNPGPILPPLRRFLSWKSSVNEDVVQITWVEENVLLACSLSF